MLDTIIKAASTNVPTVVLRWLLLPAGLLLGWGWWVHQSRLDALDLIIARVTEQRAMETEAIKDLTSEVRQMRATAQENARKQEQWAIEILRSTRR